MYQSGGRAGDEAKKRKSPAKSGRVSITALIRPRSEDRGRTNKQCQNNGFFEYFNVKY